MPVVVLSAYQVATKPEIGGHFWVYMQYAHALQRLGCEVYWLELVPDSALRGSPSLISNFLKRMARYGFEDRTLLYATPESNGSGEAEFINTSQDAAEAVSAERICLSTSTTQSTGMSSLAFDAPL